MNMREKIARAAHDAQWDEPFPNEGSIAHAMAMQVADAVLDALMEPTEGMIEAAAEIDDIDVMPEWLSMIQAAKEGK